MFTMVCEGCSREYGTKDRRTRFCSRSCAATSNQTGKRKSESHRAAISMSLRKKERDDQDRALIEIRCRVCDTLTKVTTRGRKTCLNCQSILRATISRIAAQNRQLQGTWMVGGIRPGSSRGKNGYFDGTFFNSTYELAFYLFCRDLGLRISRRVGEPFKYLHPCGSARNFYPDFVVDGDIIEIKGVRSPENTAKEIATLGVVRFVYKEELQNEVFPYVENYYGKIRDLWELYDGGPRGNRTPTSTETV